MFTVIKINGSLTITVKFNDEEVEYTFWNTVIADHRWKAIAPNDTGQAFDIPKSMIEEFILQVYLVV